MLQNLLLVGCGGFIGSASRYLVNRLFATTCTSFPIATFIVNIVGCLLIGMLFGLSERCNLLSATTMLLLTTGFCGGFTTFSTFANDIWTVSSRGDMMTSIIYLTASVILGILAVGLGRFIVK